MPELPEVEAARKLIEENCLNKKIEKAVVADDEKVIEGVAPADLASALQGRTISGVKRKGKHLWLELDSAGPWPLFHFGMTGSFSVQGQGRVKYRSSKSEDDPEAWPPKFCKLELQMEGGTSAAFCDPRRFGRVRLQTDPLANEPLCKLGFDPLLAMPSREDFEALLRQHAKGTTRIKALLLDQGFAAGVGNWVADEVLYQCRLHPEHPVADLGPQQLDSLHHHLQLVLQTAVEADADSDKFPADWLFHCRWTNKRASSVGGRAIAFITAGGRTSAYVPELQKLPPGTRVAGEKASKAGAKRKKAEAGSSSSSPDPDSAEVAAPPPRKRRRTTDGKATAAEKQQPSEDPAATKQVLTKRPAAAKSRPSAKNAGAKQPPAGKQAAARQVPADAGSKKGAAAKKQQQPAAGSKAARVASSSGGDKAAGRRKSTGAAAVEASKAAPGASDGAAIRRTKRT